MGESPIFYASQESAGGKKPVGRENFPEYLNNRLDFAREKRVEQGANPRLASSVGVL